VRLQSAFKAAAPRGARTLPLEEARALTTRLLKANSADDGVIRRACEAIATGAGGESVSFDTFVTKVGREIRFTTPKPTAGLRQGRNCCGVGNHQSKNDLSLDGIVRSAYGERAQTPCEVLLNGEDCIGAMMQEIKKAKSEIVMSWWQFCPWLPAIRGARGKAAWEFPSPAEGSTMEDWGTLPPVLKQKAEEGVKVYGRSSSLSLSRARNELLHTAACMRM
jgi:hypothetical protein